MLCSIRLNIFTEMVDNVLLNSEVKRVNLKNIIPSLFLPHKPDGNSQFLHFFLYHSYLYGTYRL